MLSIDVKDLKSVMPALGKLVGNRSHMPILRTIRIVGNDNGTVTFYGTNLDAWGAFTVPSTQTSNFAVVVNYREFGDAIKATKKGNIFLIKKDEKTLLVKTPNSEQNLSVFCGDDDWIVLSHTETEKEYPTVDVDFKQLKSASTRLVPMCSKEENRYRESLSNVAFNFTHPNQVEIVASSKYTMGISNLPIHARVGKIEEGTCAVYKPALESISKLKTKNLPTNIMISRIPSDVYSSTGYMRFHIGNHIIVSRIINDEYIDYKQFLKTEDRNTITVDAEPIRGLLSVLKPQAIMGRFTLHILHHPLDIQEYQLDEFIGSLSDPEVGATFFGKSSGELQGDYNIFHLYNLVKFSKKIKTLEIAFDNSEEPELPTEFSFSDQDAEFRFIIHQLMKVE